MEDFQIVMRLEDLIRDIKADWDGPQEEVDDVAEFQERIDNAQDGEIINLASITFDGYIKLKGKHEKPVVISGKEGTVLTCSGNDYTIKSIGKTVGFILQNLEIRNPEPSRDIVFINNETNDVSQQCENITFNKCKILGDEIRGQKRGLNLNGINMKAIGNIITSIMRDGQDSQSILIYNGAGPYLIAYNILEATGENILTGGVDCTIPNLVPSDITIENNKIRKPLEWKGTSWDIKNLVEFKCGRNIKLNHNTIEGNWVANQTGYSILLTPRNQGGSNPWAVVENVEITNNLIKNVSSVFNISGDDDAATSLRTNNILIENNLCFIDKNQFGGDGRFALIQRTPHGIIVLRNTSINNGSSWIYTSQPQKSDGCSFIDNIGYHNKYGFMASGYGSGTSSLNGGYVNWQFNGNVLAGGTASYYPPNNQFPTVAQFEAGMIDYQYNGKGCDISKIPLEDVTF